MWVIASYPKVRREEGGKNTAQKRISVSTQPLDEQALYKLPRERPEWMRYDGVYVYVRE